MGLHLRVQRHCENGEKVAEYLVNHPKVAAVYYPGLESHPNHEIAVQQMKGGFGGMLSLLINGDEVQTLSIANRLKLFTQATSLGGVERLVEHRKSVEGVKSQTPENLLRLSLGIEHIDDIIIDLTKAIEKSQT